MVSYKSIWCCGVAALALVTSLSQACNDKQHGRDSKSDIDSITDIHRTTVKSTHGDIQVEKAEDGFQKKIAGIQIVDEKVEIAREWRKDVPLHAFDAVISGSSLILISTDNRVYRFDRDDTEKAVRYEEGPYLDGLEMNYKTGGVIAIGLSEEPIESIVCSIDPALKSKMKCNASKAEYVEDLRGLVVTNDGVIWMTQLGTTLVKMTKGVQEEVDGEWGDMVVSGDGRFLAGAVLDADLTITEIYRLDVRDDISTKIQVAKPGERLFGVDDRGRVFSGKTAGCKCSGTVGYLDITDGTGKGRRKRLIEGDLTLVSISSGSLIIKYRVDTGSVIAEAVYSG